MTDIENMDRIFLRDFHLSCIVGCAPEERFERQDIVFNIELYTDFADCVASDNLRDSIDYEELRKRVRNVVEGSSFELIESLADAVAKACLEQSRCKQVVVDLNKPGGMRGSGSVAVRLCRAR